MSSDVATRPVGALAIPDDATDFTQAQLEAFGIADATRGEQLVFLHTCQRTGLDPAVRQIYMIGREDRREGRVKYTIQTGIDGYRLIADRTGLYAGSDEEWVDDDRGWPVRARVTVWKYVAAAGELRPFSAVAHWQEYAQTYWNSKEQRHVPAGQWGRMPHVMLAKCAEAKALRKAFPQDLSGVYTAEEMQQADEPVRVEQQDQPAAAPASQRAERPTAPTAPASAAPTENVEDAVVVDETPPPRPQGRAERITRDDVARQRAAERDAAQKIAGDALRSEDLEQLRRWWYGAGDDLLNTDITAWFNADPALAVFVEVPDGKPIPLKAWLTACMKQVHGHGMSIADAIAKDPHAQGAQPTDDQQPAEQLQEA